MNKICSKCKVEKEINQFHRHSLRKDGHQDRCKGCIAEQKKEWRITHKAKIAEYNADWWDAHPEKSKEYEKARKNKRKIYRQKTTEKAKAYRMSRREERRISQKKRRESNPLVKLSDNISTGIHGSLKSGKGGLRWELLVGYTLNDLRKHLEKQFNGEMGWHNQGRYWHIDHIIPISAFNFESYNDIDFKRCWALSNLRPLEATANLTKHSKIDKPFQPCLLISV